MWHNYFLPTSAASLLTPNGLATIGTPLPKQSDKSLRRMWMSGKRSIFNYYAKRDGYGPAYFNTDRFDEEWHIRFRVRAHHYLHERVTMRRELRLKLQKARDTLGLQPPRALGHRVLGVHMRGSDKRHGAIVPPSAYVYLAKRYLAARPPDATTIIFVATEDPEHLKAFASAFEKEPKTRVRVVWTSSARSTRSFQCIAGALGQPLPTWCKSGGDEAGGAAAEKATGQVLGEQVLIDAMLLSGCDALLYSESSVSEFAIDWNLHLHAHSLNAKWYISPEKLSDDATDRLEWLITRQSLRILVASNGEDGNDEHESKLRDGLLSALRRNLGHSVCDVRLYTSLEDALCRKGAAASTSTARSIEGCGSEAPFDLLLLLSPRAASTCTTPRKQIEATLGTKRLERIRPSTTVLLWPMFAADAASFDAGVVIGSGPADCDSLHHPSPVLQFKQMIGDSQAAGPPRVSPSSIHCYFAPPAITSIADTTSTDDHQNRSLTTVPYNPAIPAHVAIAKALAIAATSEATLLIDRRHPILSLRILHEGLHALAYSSEKERKKKFFRGMRSKLLATDLKRMREALLEHIEQHHTWSVRSGWLSHVMSAALRGRHYDQQRLVWGSN